MSILPFRSQCDCICHTRPGILHIMECCNPDPQPAPTQAADEAAVECFPKHDESELGWNIVPNLRWLAEQAERPARVPTGDLTGVFLKLCADRLVELSECVKVQRQRAEQAEKKLAEAEALFKGVRRDIVDQRRDIITCTVWHLDTGGFETTVDVIDTFLASLNPTEQGGEG